MAFGTMFEDGRAGDAFVTTRSYYGFRKVKAGNHGGIVEGDMKVPMLLHMPQARAPLRETVRPMDLYPMVMDWFGIPVSHKNYDGESPFESRARSAVDEKLAALDQLFSESPPMINLVIVGKFVRDKVFPIVGPSEFPEVLRAARMEAERRKLTSRKLGDLKAMLLKQKKGDNVSAADPNYLDDHLEIVSRELENSRASQRMLEEIISILEHCASPDSDVCLRL
jgi:hypothetical protein